MATIDRPTLTAWLTAWRGAIATAAGLTLDDTPGGWGPALDEVVATNTTYPTLTDPWVAPITDYWGLRLVANALDTRFDLMAGGDQMHLSDVADRVRGQLAVAEAKIRPWLITAGAFGPAYAGGLSRSDVWAHELDPDASPPLFTRRTGPPIVGHTGAYPSRYWP